MSLLSIHHFLYAHTFLHVYYLAGDESEGEGESPTDIYNRDGATRGASREGLGCSLAPELNPVISLIRLLNCASGLKLGWQSVFRFLAGSTTQELFGRPDGYLTFKRLYFYSGSKTRQMKYANMK